MILNNLKIAVRHLYKNKIYSLVNIGGLALGIASFLLILQFVSLEKSVNQFHTKVESTYRVLCQNVQGENWPQVEPGWADKIKNKLPEVKSYCRFAEGIASGIVQNQSKNISFREQNLGYAEGNFFTFFSFPLLYGSANDFNNPGTVFISASSSKKYFGNENPLGKTLAIYNQFGDKVYTVKGVYNDMGDESDIRFDILFSLETLKNKANLNGNYWADLDNLDNQYINLFLELTPGLDVKAFEKKITALRRELQVEKDALAFRVQPMTEMHLAKSNSDDLQHTGNRRYVYMLIGISFLILLIAWFNYVNLSTANAIKRANEVGVRKVIGANRRNLVGLFMTESLLVKFFAFVIGILLVYLLQPLFNDLLGKELGFTSLFLNTTWISGLCLILAGSLLTGIYTAFALSGFKPVKTLKRKIAKTASGALLRKSLVVTQFSISIALIVSTILVYSQLRYMQRKNLGFDISQLLFIPAPSIGLDSTYNQRKTAYLDEMMQQSFVKDYCTSGSGPGRGFNFATDGFTSPRSKPGDEAKSYSFAIIGERYLPAYNIPLKAGRNFTASECAVSWNDNDKVIMNERATTELGFENPEDALTTKIKWDERYLQIIGVVKDYHHEGLQRAIVPMIFYPAQVNDLTVKLTADNMPAKIAALEKIYKKYFAGNPFEYFFMDEFFNRQYKSEMQFGKLFTTAALLAILIACMGLFGLTVFAVESRIKEIGIRKVLGASAFRIASMLSKDFLKLVAVAIIIASPIAWYFMNQWLQDFAYRINIAWWVFLLAGIIALFIALVTISFQAIKAAIANPVKSLRTE
jgi:putative ABC transport system permease protein